MAIFVKHRLKSWRPLWPSQAIDKKLTTEIRKNPTGKYKWVHEVAARGKRTASSEL
ncbi:hypothetical protein EAM01S_27_00110 [Erwinia amylovora NBRC 12687 = CFBP 1232]|nr:hypothetical protein EAM01S_27_00110 [Erwinia amylovora NBRC 12687 = CFBP 1232]